MSKYQTTQYNKYSRCLTHIRDLYSKARAFHMSADAIAKEYNEKIQPEMKGLSQYYVGVLNGYKNCLYDSLWAEMEFCYIVDDTLYTTSRSGSNKPCWDALPDFNMSGKLRAHYWRGTDIPYTALTKA